MNKFVSFRKKWFLVLLVCIFASGSCITLLAAKLLSKEKEDNTEKSLPEKMIDCDSATIRLKDIYLESGSTDGIVVLLEITNKTEAALYGQMVNISALKDGKLYDPGMNVTLNESEMADIFPYFQNMVKPIVQWQTVTVAKWLTVDQKDLDGMVVSIEYAGNKIEVTGNDIRRK